jgi:hypothetical protein
MISLPGLDTCPLRCLFELFESVEELRVNPLCLLFEINFSEDFVVQIVRAKRKRKQSHNSYWLSSYRITGCLFSSLIDSFQTKFIDVVKCENYERIFHNCERKKDLISKKHWLRAVVVDFKWSLFCSKDYVSLGSQLQLLWKKFALFSEPSKNEWRKKHLKKWANSFLICRKTLLLHWEVASFDL